MQGATRCGRCAVPQVEQSVPRGFSAGPGVHRQKSNFTVSICAFTLHPLPRHSRHVTHSTAVPPSRPARVALPRLQVQPQLPDASRSCLRDICRQLRVGMHGNDLQLPQP